MKSLYVRNFKNIKELSIDSLGRVNLITGKNNTGKTSLLEAVSIYVSEGRMNNILNLLTRRGEAVYEYNNENPNEGYLGNNIKVLSSIFYNRVVSFREEEAIKIGEISSDKQVVLDFIKYRLEEGNPAKKIRIFNDFDVSYGENIRFEFKISYNDKAYAFYDLEHNLKRRNGVFAKRADVFSSNTDDMTNAFLWDKVVLTEKEDYVIQALKIIESSVERLTFIDNEESSERQAVIKVKGERNIYSLKSMGDGINRILSIILALVNCSDGVLLIDELENGLHFTAQEKLWEIIFKIATDLNIQVFATTHSNDCIFSFARVLQKVSENESLGKIFRLDKVEDNIEAVAYSQEELKTILEQNIEIRL